MDKNCIKENLVVIITYNPQKERLFQNILSTMRMQSDVLIIDNGSENYKSIEEIIEKFESKIISIHYEKNNGIAYALYNAMEFAIKEDYKWVLTLDQDSIPEKGLLGEYNKYKSDDVGAITCRIKDINYQWRNDKRNRIGDVNECITSGCLMSTYAYKKTSGYCKDMFIDFVDNDICYAIREKGYRIIRIPYDGLLHEYGKGRINRFFFMEYVVTNHPYWRKYYMSRNYIILRKRHPNFISTWKVLYYLIGLYVKSIYEKEKFKRFAQITKGIRDGLFIIKMEHK